MKRTRKYMTRCVVCGARARVGTICSAMCTRARKAGVSREEQIRNEMDSRDWSSRDYALRTHGRVHMHALTQG